MTDDLTEIPLQPDVTCFDKRRGKPMRPWGWCNNSRAGIMGQITMRVASFKAPKLADFGKGEK